MANADSDDAAPCSPVVFKASLVEALGEWDSITEALRADAPVITPTTTSPERLSESRRFMFTATELLELAGLTRDGLVASRRAQMEEALAGPDAARAFLEAEACVLESKAVFGRPSSPEDREAAEKFVRELDECLQEARQRLGMVSAPPLR